MASSVAKCCQVFPEGAEVPLSDLDQEIQDLIHKSKEAQAFAYCPYSNFKVGAALQAENGTIYTGCNVENSAYGVTICAERTAVVKAVSEGQKKFKALAVIGSNNEAFTTPCGACRQFIAEFGLEIKIYLPKQDLSKVKISSSGGLLPYAFAFG